jgi:hypothetical protein
MLGHVVDDDGVGVLQACGDAGLPQRTGAGLIGFPGAEVRLQQQLLHRDKPL